MPSASTCRAEVELLHDFFVKWFTGELPTDSIDRLERALASDFEMVTPDGARREFADVVAGVEDGYATHDPGVFDIDIRNVEIRHADDETTLVRYEEWQDTPDGKTGRVSTALFADDPDAPGGVIWLDLQETWLEGPHDQS